MRIMATLATALAFGATASAAEAQALTGLPTNPTVHEPYPGLSFVTPPPQTATTWTVPIDRTGSINRVVPKPIRR